MENIKYSAEMRNFLITTFVSVFICLVGYLIWTRRKLYYASFQLPGPLALPLLGNLFNYIGLNSTGEDIFNQISNLYAKWGSTLRIWAGPKLFIFVSKPEDLETIFTNPDCMHRDLLVMKSLKAILGDGLLTSEVPLWKIHRKLINPTFNLKIVNGYFDTFSWHAKHLSENLGGMVGKGKFDILPMIFHTTVRLIYETSLGANENTFINLDEKIAERIEETMSICFQRMAKPWLYLDFIFNLTSQGRVFKKNKDYIWSILDMMIQKIRQEMKSKENTIKTNNTCKGKNLDDDIKISGKKIFIDLLMELNENGVAFTDAELNDQINTIFATGSDTTAHTTCFVCLLLGANPECQEKAYAEIREVLGDSDRDLTLEDVSQLKYLERVIKETLRIFPLVPISVRSMKKDVQFADVVAPAGSTILFSTFLTQRDPKIWPDPLKFDPDRFLPEEVSKRHPYSYVPFYGGSRNCIGNRYAMLAMKVILSTLIRKYKLKSTVDVAHCRLSVEIIMKFVEGYQLEVELRNK